jgi:hypothetical protein
MAEVVSTVGASWAAACSIEVEQISRLSRMQPHDGHGGKDELIREPSIRATQIFLLKRAISRIAS